jgi:hypothetical protein
VETQFDPGFEQRTYIQVSDAGDLEALRRLRSTVILLLSAMAKKEVIYVGKEQ